MTENTVDARGLAGPSVRCNQLQEVVKSHVRKWTTAITVLADGHLAKWRRATAGDPLLTAEVA